jgi:hypothetical protein
VHVLGGVGPDVEPGPDLRAGDIEEAFGREIAEDAGQRTVGVADVDDRLEEEEPRQGGEW